MRPVSFMRHMLKGRQRLGVSVTIRVNPRIVRHGPPAVGSCFFDDGDRLIYITANPAVRYFYWRRVFTTGHLSEKEYAGTIMVTQDNRCVYLNVTERGTA